MTAAELSAEEAAVVARFNAAPVPTEVVEIAIATVHRVQTDTGSHIDPPVNDDWADLDKLRWCLAVLHDADLPPDTLKVEPAMRTVNGVPFNVYQLSRTGWALSGGDFHDTWQTITAIGYGVALERLRAEAAR